jgi:acetolactate synthase I/II/III large subunit
MAMEPGPRKGSVAMFVHEAVAEALAAAGTNALFGLIGDANLFMVNSFVEKQGGTYVSAVHEASAVMMAAGYAARTAGLGVATVTQGPGLTNTGTALIEAVRSSTPIVLITGDTAPGNTLNQQSLSQEPFVAATGADYLLVARPQDAATAIRRATARAVAYSRPVVVNIPTEYQWNLVDPSLPSADPPQPQPPHASDEVLNDAVGVIASARRPLVLAGRGATGPDQRTAVLDFARRIGAPVATTLRARNLYSAAEGSIGIFGTLSGDVGSQIIAETDCVIAFGASLNTWTTDRNSLTKGKAVIHVDDDARSLNRNTQATVAVHGDAALTARTFIEWLDAAEVPPAPFRERVCGILIEADLSFTRPLGERVTLAGVLSSVNRALPERRTAVFDGGRFLGEAFKYIDAAWNSQILSTSFGAVGMGMGAAIGAACAARGEPTVLVTGDGGFMMNGLAELHSAVRAGTPIIVVICNDGSYGAEYDQYVNKNVNADLSLFSWPSFAEVARTLGADGFTINTVADVEPALAAIASPRRPVVIDVHVGPADIPEVAH